MKTAIKILTTAPGFFPQNSMAGHFRIFFLLFLLSTLHITAQDSDPADDPDLFTRAAREERERKIKKHEDLETELELYPLNMIHPRDPIVKNEAMFDYHRFSRNEKLLGGVRFFADANTHYEGSRDMKDLILYTTAYFGFRNFQMGAEIGSITNQEYLSVGPQFTSYDNEVFKRVSIITRIVPDLIFGYEFTTQEVKLFDGIKLSGTGMGRVAYPANEIIIQASAWLSSEKMRGVYFGFEYEYNNARYFNNNRFEANNELFLGIKFELK